MQTNHNSQTPSEPTGQQNFICVNCKRVTSKRPDCCKECGHSTFENTLADVTQPSAPNKPAAPGLTDEDRVRIVEKSDEIYQIYGHQTAVYGYRLGYKEATLHERTPMQAKDTRIKELEDKVRELEEKIEHLEYGGENI